MLWILLSMAGIVIGIIWGVLKNKLTTFDVGLLIAVYLFYSLIGYLFGYKMLYPISFVVDGVTFSFVGVMLFGGTFLASRYFVHRFVAKKENEHTF